MPISKQAALAALEKAMEEAHTHYAYDYAGTRLLVVSLPDFSGERLRDAFIEEIELAEELQEAEAVKLAAGEPLWEK